VDPNIEPWKEVLNTNYSCFCLPVAGMAYNYELVRVVGKKENNILFAVKCLLYIYYIGILIVAYSLGPGIFFKLANFTLIFVPLYFIVYSHYIFNNKYVSQPGAMVMNGDQ
jgi:hypothetical protein